MKWNYQNIKLLQLDCYLSAARRTLIENLLPSPKRDGLGGQHHHRCDYFLKPLGSIILRCFWDIQYYNDDYFTIITIIGPTINRSYASPKSISGPSLNSLICPPPHTYLHLVATWWQLIFLLVGDYFELTYWPFCDHLVIIFMITIGPLDTAILVTN